MKRLWELWRRRRTQQLINENRRLLEERDGLLAEIEALHLACEKSRP